MRRHGTLALLTLLLVALFATPAFALVAPTSAPRDEVNAVLGDASFVARFGRAPRATDPEDLRLQTHLEHVERLLRASDVSHLSASQRAARARNLDLLHAYWQRGVFPRNHTVPGRRPHFIDEAGRVCAVGYLVEQTAGRPMAEAINRRFEWAYIPEITGPEIDAWVASSGLSRRELAMIQPSYNHMPGRPVEPAPRPIVIGPRPPVPPPQVFPRPTPTQLASLIRDAQRPVEQCFRDNGYARGVAYASVVLNGRAVNAEIQIGGVAPGPVTACISGAVRTAIAPALVRFAGPPVRATQALIVAPAGNNAPQRVTVRDVRRALDAQLTGMLQCLAGPDGGPRVSGTIRIQLTALPEGAMGRVDVSAPRMPAQAEAVGCITAVVRNVNLPAFPGRAIATTYSFRVGR